MVTSTLDEYILQIFEEQEEQFYFPLISQKTARSFVKAMHSKGVSYEDICSEIDEFEHNFSAWRKGLGRVGIGNRILERINAPLQEILDSEDEDEDGPTLAEKIANVNKSKAQKEAEVQKRINGNNNNTTTTTQNGSNSTPLHKLDRDAAKEKSRDLTEAWTKNIEEKMERIDRDKERDREEEARKEKEEEQRKKKEDQVDSSSSAASTRESTPKRGSTPEQRELSESAKVFERIRGRKPGQDAGVTEEDVEDKKEEESQEKEVVVRTKSQEKEVVTRTRSQEKEVVTRTKSQEKEVVMRKKTQEKEAVKEEPEEDASKRKSVKDIIANKEEVLSAPSSPQPAKDETREERLAKLQEKIAALKKKFPKNEGEQQNDDAPASPSKERAGSPSPKLERKLSSPKPVRKLSSPKPERKLSGSVSPKPQSPLVSRSSSRSDSPQISAPDSPRLGVGNRGSSSDDNHSSRSPRVSMPEPDIMESYDSDLDIDGDDVAFEVKNLVAKIRSMKHSQQDGTGYLYVFTDGDTNDASEQRVKVGASRYPTSRLEQARLFNLDLEMSSSVSVSRRKEALREVAAEIADMRINGTEDWYQASINDVLDTVMKVADKFPMNMSQC